MVPTFTEDDRLREKERLHEEWLRVQRGEKACKERLQRELEQEKKIKETILQRIEKMELCFMRLMKKSEVLDERNEEIV